MLWLQSLDSDSSFIVPANLSEDATVYTRSTSGAADMPAGLSAALLVMCNQLWPALHMLQCHAPVLMLS